MGVGRVGTPLHGSWYVWGAGPVTLALHPPLTVHPQTREDWAGSLARAENNTGPKSYKSLFNSLRKSNLYFPCKMDGGHSLRAC